jgi:site-specific DNA-methyltransferase (cytosine-N4-specific)
VVDPFGGSNITGAVAESLGRRWISIDIDEQYVHGSAARFESIQAELELVVQENHR